MIIEHITPRRGEAYWLASARWNGRRFLAEGRTRAEARLGLLDLISRRFVCQMM